ncbi:hypothetical protein BH10PSE17_BH10PSE17_04930 [soil metagenome]
MTEKTARPVRIAQGIALFIAIVVTLRFTQYWLLTRRQPDNWLSTPSGLLIEEVIRAAIVIAATWAVARFEGTQATRFGMGGPHRVRLLLLGSLVGLISIACVIAAQFIGGQVQLALEPTPWSEHLVNGVTLLAAFYAVGVFEEMLLRGYLQVALARGIGFWPAAVAWSAVFVWMHTGNDNESLLGLAQTGWVALFFCLALRLTGSLWWVIGYHALWDWGESFVFGVPNSGLLFEGRLMTASPVGPALWSGGAGGPEASLWSLFVLVLPVAALLIGRRGNADVT